MHELATELARLKGSSATRAVLEALENELERMRQPNAPDWDAVARLQERVEDTAKDWLTDHELYDNSGLPK